MALLSHILLKSGITINFRLILSNLNDPDSNKRYFSIKIGRHNIFLPRLNSKRALSLFVVLLLPISVSAGLIEAISNILFDSSKMEEIANGVGIQNMSLLAAAVVPSGDLIHVPVVEDNALVSEAGPTGVTPTAKPTSDQISIYIVHEGDTLSQIAEMFNVTVNTIKWSNDIRSVDELQVGQTLAILPITGVKHVVAKGDTLESVTKKYSADLNEILAYNSLSREASLEIGSTIIIPDGEISASVQGNSSYTGPDYSNLKEYVGYYLRPVAGGIKTQGLHGHNAIDIGAPVGTPIMAAADGQVIIVKTGGWNGGYGNYIVIKHPNGTQTLYAHNSRNNVSVGQEVKQGDVVALIGTTGKITGPHLHFEVRGAKNPF